MPVGWLGKVKIEGSDEPKNVVLEEREGNRVFVREADPADGEPPRIPLFEGDQIVMMMPLAAVSLSLDAPPK